MHHEDQVIPALLAQTGRFRVSSSIRIDRVDRARVDPEDAALHQRPRAAQDRISIWATARCSTTACARSATPVAAGRRIQAARCCRRYPEAWGYLREREVCIMTLAMIEPIVTDDNKDEIFRAGARCVAAGGGAVDIRVPAGGGTARSHPVRAGAGCRSRKHLNRALLIVTVRARSRSSIAIRYRLERRCSFNSWPMRNSCSCSKKSAI